MYTSAKICTVYVRKKLYMCVSENMYCTCVSAKICTVHVRQNCTCASELYMCVSENMYCTCACLQKRSMVPGSKWPHVSIVLCFGPIITPKYPSPLLIFSRKHQQQTILVLRARCNTSFSNKPLHCM